MSVLFHRPLHFLFGLGLSYVLAAVLLAWSDVAEARLDERDVRQHKLSVCETPTEGN